MIVIPVMAQNVHLALPGAMTAIPVMQTARQPVA
jgi:hypothetical protein